jgi:hypothetical protein
MKKILMLLPILAVCACNKTQTYIVGQDAVCTGLEENNPNPVFCADVNGQPINGIVKQYYENGKIWREMTIKNGLENGEEREFYENGKLHVIANVVNGKTDGISKLYNEDGKLYMELNWQDGEVVETKIYDENGNIIQTPDVQQ